MLPQIDSILISNWFRFGIVTLVFILPLNFIISVLVGISMLMSLFFENVLQILSGKIPTDASDKEHLAQVQQRVLIHSKTLIVLGLIIFGFCLGLILHFIRFLFP